MKFKRNQIPIYCLFLVIGFVFATTSHAETYYLPESSITIETSLLVRETPGLPDKVKPIIIQPGKMKASDKPLHFYLSEQNQFIGTLNLADTGVVEWTGTGCFSTIFQDTDFLIVPGIAFPVDVLPVHTVLNTDTPLEYAFSRTAGDQIFLQKIRVSATAVSLEQARQSGWIRCEHCDLSSLYMIAATDAQTGALIVKQLWCPEEDWWVYEETPLRHSWRTQ